MPITQVTVEEIVTKAVNGEVDIPEFQRDFVWDPEKVKKLAESLYRNYPIGSFLLWNSSEYSQPRMAEHGRIPLWIVDGQQRITALCLLLGEKPYWWDNAQSWNEHLERYDVMANLLPDEDDDRLEFALPNPARRNDPRWISIRRVLSRERLRDLTSLAQEIVSSVKGELDTELFSKVFARLSQLWQIRERVIPVIEINHEAEDVVEIFARLNQEGTRVKEADVILAVIAGQNPGWVRNEYLPFRNELADGGWDLEAGIFIRTMSSIGIGRARLIEVPRDFWDRSLSNVWGTTKRIIQEVLLRLAEYGITSVDLLPSTNSLIPLFVLHYCWGDKRGYRFGKALRWFLRANWDGRYSGAAITSLNEDIRSIMEAKSFDEAIENLEKRLRVPQKIDGSEFLNRYDQAGSRFLRLMLYLLIFRREARDWLDGTRIGYDKTGAKIASGFEPHWHHIYSRSVLKREGIPDDEINCLANITVLNRRPNIRLGHMLPSQYIQRFQISEEDLRRHLIPDAFAKVANNPELLEKQWSLERYTEFLFERANLLAEEANRFLEELENSSH